MRTELWARGAEPELRATGETARRREISIVTELTPQEMQIAWLVAEGLTNKEITDVEPAGPPEFGSRLAAQLFIAKADLSGHEIVRRLCR